MLEEDIQQAIIDTIPDAQVTVALDGNHAHIQVISNAFEGLMPVKKQQLVNPALQPFVASGAVHAVHMKTLTPSEAEA